MQNLCLLKLKSELLMLLIYLIMNPTKLWMSEKSEQLYVLWDAALLKVCVIISYIKEVLDG